MGKPPDVQYFVRRNAYFKPSVRNFEFKVNKIERVNRIIPILFLSIQLERLCINNIQVQKYIPIPMNVASISM